MIGMCRDHELWADAGAAHQIIEAPEIFCSAKFDAGLFQGLATRRRLGRLIAGLASTSRESHMTRPGIARSKSTFDQQDFAAAVALP